jgi:hypothetical protein
MMSNTKYLAKFCSWVLVSYLAEFCVYSLFM